MEPPVRDPAIRDALTEKITTEITIRLNVISHANQAAAELSSRGLPTLSTLLKSECQRPGYFLMATDRPAWTAGRPHGAQRKDSGHEYASQGRRRRRH
jgi:hypothetical protein